MRELLERLVNTHVWPRSDVSPHLWLCDYCGANRVVWKDLDNYEHHTDICAWAEAKRFLEKEVQDA